LLKYEIVPEQVKLLFAAERKVCDQIFEGFDSLSDQCFAEVTTNSISMLLSFGEAIAKSKRSPEKLFVLLDMYEILQEIHSEVFSFKIQILESCRNFESTVKVFMAVLYAVRRHNSMVVTYYQLFLWWTICRLKYSLKAELAPK